MALCLACSLVCRRDFIPYDQLVRYKWWYRDGYMSSTGKCFDIGAATSQSLHKFEDRQILFAKEYNIPDGQLDFLSDTDLLGKFNVYCSNIGVAGNGALMRLTPVPLFFYKYPIHAVEFSGVSGQITHGDQKAYDACRYYGALIVAALRGETKEKLLDKNFYRDHISWFNDKPLSKEVMEIALGSYKKKHGYEDGIRGKGYIINALEAALWAFWSDGNSFKTGALNAVNLGDDTDTTAAIYGQLAGAYYKHEKLPPDWVKYVYAHDFMTCLSKWIVYEGELWQPESAFSNIQQSSSRSYSGIAARSNAENTQNIMRTEAANHPYEQLSATREPLPSRQQYPSHQYDRNETALMTQYNINLGMSPFESQLHYSDTAEPHSYTRAGPTNNVREQYAADRNDTNHKSRFKRPKILRDKCNQQ